MASLNKKIDEKIEEDLDIITKRAIKNRVEALSQTYKSESLDQICKKYLQLFQDWQKKRTNLKTQRAQELQQKKSGVEIAHQEILQGEQEELLNQEGEHLLEKFQDEFGIHIDLLIATQLRSDEEHSGTYIQIGVPALQDVKKYQTAGQSGFGDIHINSSESFFAESNTENAIITIPINNKINENIDKKDLLIYIEGINNYLKQISNIMTIDKILTADNLIKNGKGAIGRAAEMLIGSYLTYEHVNILYNYFQNYPKYTKRALGSKKDYYTLGFDEGQAILTMLKPDNMSYFTTGDFEYSNLNYILSKSKFLFDLQNSPNLTTTATKKMLNRIKNVQNVKYQIKQSGATIKYNTTNSYINMLVVLLQQDTLQELFATETKGWFRQILSKVEGAAAKDYFTRLVKELKEQGKIVDEVEQTLLKLANTKGTFTAGQR